MFPPIEFSCFSWASSSASLASIRLTISSTSNVGSFGLTGSSVFNSAGFVAVVADASFAFSSSAFLAFLAAINSSNVGIFGASPPPNGFPKGLLKAPLLPSSLIFFLFLTNSFTSNNFISFISLVGNSALPNSESPQSVSNPCFSLVLKGFIRFLKIITSFIFNFCKSDTVTNGCEAVLSSFLDLTSPHNLEISSNAANSVVKRYIKLPQLERIVSASSFP